MSVKVTNTVNSERTELRKFGLTVGIVLSLLGVLFLWRDKDCYPHFITVSIVFLFLGLVLPLLLKPIHKLWMTLSLLMGWFMTRVILSVLFYLVVTPIGLLARLCGKDFLDMTIDRNVNSYWIPRKTITCDKKNYENQF